MFRTNKCLSSGGLYKAADSISPYIFRRSLVADTIRFILDYCINRIASATRLLLKMHGEMLVSCLCRLLDDEQLFVRNMLKTILRKSAHLVGLSQICVVSNICISCILCDGTCAGVELL